MYEFHPYYTNDGSVGLYSQDFDDIYHSSTGALTEAYEKFILPVDFENLLKKDEIKILDICYGIGYNSKSFLNFIFENYCKNKYKNFENIFFKISKFSKKIFSYLKNKLDPSATDYYAPIYTNKTIKSFKQTCSGAIYTNNISNNDNQIECIEQIDTDNIFSKISITAVDNDKILTYLSPFVKTGENNFKNDSIDFNKKNLDKYLQKENKIKPQKIDKLINFLIFEKIAQNTSDFYTNEAVSHILSESKYAKFFERDIRVIYRGEILNRYKTIKPTILDKLTTFLHNIYYQYITRRYKKWVREYNLEGLTFDLKIDDARSIIKNDKPTYNLIFLDAFTPSKCPCLWSYEFFRELYNHLEPDGMLLTYSTSASIRSAMLEAGFNIGNIYNEREGKFTGTIATKDKSLIKNELSEFDLGLLKTSAGIFYRDKNLIGQNEAIFEARKKEVENTDRISTSQYKKKFNRGKSC